MAIAVKRFLLALDLFVENGYMSVWGAHTRYKGIKVMGTDGYIPLHVQAVNYKANPRAGVIWQVHYVGIEKEYYQIEKLANLDQLSPFGFKVACFPAKIKGVSAGWTRAVAIIE